MNRLSSNNSRSFYISLFINNILKLSFIIKWISKYINNSTQQTFPRWNFKKLLFSLYNFTFLNIFIVTQYNNSNIIFFYIKNNTLSAIFKLHYFIKFNIIKSVCNCNTIKNFYNLPYFFKFYCLI